MLAIAVQVAVILIMVGIEYGLRLHPDLVRTWVGAFALILLWCVLGVCLATITVSRYAVISERGRDLGILKLLGASSSDILKLLFQETLLLIIPGTTVGVALAYGTKGLIAFALSGFITQVTVYKWWPLAGAVSSVTVLLGGILAARKAVRQDLVDLLSSKDERKPGTDGTFPIFATG